MTTDPHPWAATLDDLHAPVWMQLVRGIRDCCASAWHLTLASTSPGGWPGARTLVLRGADCAAATEQERKD